MRYVGSLVLILAAAGVRAQSPPLVLPADVRGACAVIATNGTLEAYRPFCRLDLTQLSGVVIPEPQLVMRLARCPTGPCAAADSLAALGRALADVQPIIALASDGDTAQFRDRFRALVARLKQRLGPAANTHYRATVQLQAWADLYALVQAARFRPSADLSQLIKEYASLLGRMADTTPQTLVANAQAALPVTAPVAAGLVGESDLLWGVTDFLVERASAELQAFFLERATDRVCNDPLGIEALSATCRELRRAEDRGIVPPALIRAAIRADLARLPAFALALAPNDPNAQAAHAVLRLLEVVLERRDHALRAVSALWATVPLGDLDRQPVRLALYRMSVLADLALRLGAERWDDWPMIARAVAVNVAWGGVPEWGPRPEGVGSWPFDPLGLDRAVQVLRSAPDGGTSAEALRVVVRRVLEAARGLAGPEANRRLDQARGAVAYAQQAIETFGSADYVGGAIASMRLVEAVGLAGDTVPLPLLLLAEVAQANDAAGVTAAMHRFANTMTSAPPKRSRRARPVLGVNAYLGVLGGGETNPVPGGNVREQFFGAFAPIGIEWSPLARLGPLAPGLLLHVIDVGALASYRLSDTDGVSENPEVTFRQVFALGLYATFAIRGSPLSLGFGFSNAPRLRTIDVGGVTEQVGARRFGAFLAVDVPLYRR